MPISPKTNEQKLYEIREFVELINKLNYRRDSENKILGGLNEQKGAPNFMLDQKAGAGFVEKYDLVPGKELYDGYIKKLEDVKFQEMTTEQKQMVLLILCAGIFYGDYEYFCGMENLSNQQKVALDLMAQDVDKVKNNIVPILNRINTNGRDENLKQMYHNTFDMYSPVNGWGPKRTYYGESIGSGQYYSEYTYKRCAQWAKDPQKNKSKIAEHKDYMLISLLPKDKPAMFRLLRSTGEWVTRPDDVNGYFRDYRLINNINVLIGFLQNYDGDNRYILAPAITPWIKCMRSGVEQSIAQTKTNIQELDADVADWEQKIGIMYDVLNTVGKKLEK